MKQIIHKAASRGHFDYGWLNTHHTFSFARYYDAERVSFGALRVLNDDIIAPDKGFGLHPHDNMEIISIPINGSLKHRDSMGHEQLIRQNEVQVMSAGTGIFHSEYNGSKHESANFLQIWILPQQQDVEPVYHQKYFDPVDAQNRLQDLVYNDTNSLSINQQVRISRGFFDQGKGVDYSLMSPSMGVYIFLIEGTVQVNGIMLTRRDGLGISDVDLVPIKVVHPSQLLFIEVPMMN